MNKNILINLLQLFSDTGKVLRYWVLQGVLLGSACTLMGPEKEWNNPVDRVVYCVPEIDSLTQRGEVRINRSIIFTAYAHCTDDSTVKYLWSVDKNTSIDTTTQNFREFKWGLKDTGVHIISVKAINAFGNVSGSFEDSVFLHVSYPYISNPISDTSVNQFAQIKKALTAGDADGIVKKYYWSIADTGWTDSSSSASDAVVVLENASGGPLRVRWAVVDDDELMTSDTFSVNFNRGPDSLVLLQPAAGKDVPFDMYSSVNNVGTILCTYAAFDPDENDVFVYTFEVVNEAGDTLLLYHGQKDTARIENVPALSQLRWWLKAKDAFGDSVTTAGTFTVQRPSSLPEGMVPVSNMTVKVFRMGQTGFDTSESPIHAVQFSDKLLIDTTEVTNAEYAEIVGGTTDESDTAEYPVSGISWFDAVLFCNKKSISRGYDTAYVYSSIIETDGVVTGFENFSTHYQTSGFRLPTEAEWEYANRLDSLTLYFWGNDLLQAQVYSWTRDNSGDRKHNVATKRPSRNNLYDMAGNVWEWCNDWYAADYYQKSPELDPAGPESGTQKVLRGGSYQNSNYFVQSGTRSKLDPSFTSSAVGFRTVIVIR